MAKVQVYDRWHLSRPQPTATPCSHGTDKAPRYPSADHGQGERWQVRYRDTAGRQRKENFEKKAKADARANAVGAELDRGTFLDPTLAKTTFRAFAEDWRTNRPHDLPTAARIEREFRLHVHPVIGQRTMRELDRRPSLTQAWITSMKLAPSSALQVIKDVSAVFLAAVEDGLMNRNPLASRSVRRPAASETKAQPWTLAMVEAMSAALADRQGCSRYAVMPYLGSGTGERQGEMFGQAVDDIDLLRRTVHVDRQIRLIDTTPVFAPVKNDKPHAVPLSDSLSTALAEHIRRYPPTPVTLPWKVPGGELRTFRLLLTRPGGLPMHRSWFNQSVWRPALRGAGIATVRENGCHALRHTAASAWLAAGIDITAVAEFLGDTVATVAKTYAHFMPSTTDRARRAMDEFFTAAEPGALDVPSGRP